MKEMVLEQIGPTSDSPLVLRQVSDPQPAAGEVRVKIAERFVERAG